MTRFDGRGYHPTVRPFIPHRNRERNKRNKTKVMRIVSPKAWQLAMMRLKMCFVADRDEIITLDKLFDSGLLDSSETMLMEPICAGEVSCGMVGDYSMVHTDPSRPPPKNTWIHKAIQYIVVLLLAALMAMATACHKDPTPEPNPNHPTDTITPPKRNDTLFVNLATSPRFGPWPDTVRSHLDKPDIERVIIHLFREKGIGYPVNCSGYSPGVFHKAREQLQQDIDVDSTRVSLFIIFEVRNVNAPNHEWSQEQPGITPYDKAWFESKGASFIILDKNKFK